MHFNVYQFRDSVFNVVVCFYLFNFNINSLYLYLFVIRMNDLMIGFNYKKFSFKLVYKIQQFSICLMYIQLDKLVLYAVVLKWLTTDIAMSTSLTKQTKEANIRMTPFNLRALFTYF